MAESAAARASETAASAAEAVSDITADVYDQSREAIQGARDSWSDLDVSLRAAIRERPYTALLCAGALGFLYAVARNR